MKEHKYTEAELYNKFSALCAFTEYCISDIRKKMQRLDPEAEHTERVIERLVKENFINESRYATAFVKDKFRHNRWGAVRIAMELRSRGIENEVIDLALQEITYEDVAETLHALIRKKLPSVKGNSDYEVKMKLMRFAVSRGFEPERVRRTVEEVMSSLTT